MEASTWAALTAALTVAGAIWTWIAFRRRGAVNGLRALGFTLLPAAAWLTGTLEMVVEIGSAVTSWATSLVFDVRTWVGVGLAGLAVVLFVISGFLRDRQLARAQAGGSTGGAAGGAAGGADRTRPAKQRESLPKAGSSGARGGSPIDDDMADIEALLRKRGIE
ncbi:cellulose synthase [Nocardioides hwasunensis]|uniref:Cellulose synthase n=1 Tax=Nocardioides hwasunensis TaxID=397258 RepID=A0ABR8MC75_9ACTN|nr:cellulose synthase [Nocardioides hwasunensis]MBD3913749.1 cellulose synthase [Nocardioides hwasunensis]